MLWIAVGTGPGVITRKLWPPSTDPSQALRWVPVPVGPLTNTRPWGSAPIVGSPQVWIGSATAGVSKAICPPFAAAAPLSAPLRSAPPAQRPAATSSHPRRSNVPAANTPTACPLVDRRNVPETVRRAALGKPAAVALAAR